ncbi:LysM domain-containing protein [Mycobacterium sp. NPDC050853]|uniref:LysM peptidoglycan-binding domain-containing protein n=1 Tax=Mycobacteriaceae TaxID=1762 RepID=UPI0015DF9FCF|nr:LysM peptidoglycan-binding domain-containing protein [Mycobacteroides sp. LB1]
MNELHAPPTSGKHAVRSGDTLWKLSELFYGDGRRYRVIAVVNGLSDPDLIEIGQELEIPYVTFRYQVKAGDTKGKIAEHFYGSFSMSGVFESPSGVSQRDLIVGEWLLIPDLANVGHHTVMSGETLQVLADRWYGDWSLWIVIAIANQLAGDDPEPGSVLIQPRLNRRHTVVAGDTLWKLASQNYGDYGDDRTQMAVAMTAAANLIDDLDHITVGQVIYFPSIDLGG